MIIAWLPSSQLKKEGNGDKMKRMNVSWASNGMGLIIKFRTAALAGGRSVEKGGCGCEDLGALDAVWRLINPFLMSPVGYKVGISQRVVEENKKGYRIWGWLSRAVQKKGSIRHQIYVSMQKLQYSEKGFRERAGTCDDNKGKQVTVAGLLRFSEQLPLKAFPEQFCTYSIQWRP